MADIGGNISFLSLRLAPDDPKGAFSLQSPIRQLPEVVSRHSLSFRDLLLARTKLCTITTNSEDAMYFLFFDTETTGLPRNPKAPAADLKNWPRLVQIAWLLMDAQGREHRCEEHIIKPKGFTIPPEAARIHGITTDIAMMKGTDLAPVLDSFKNDLLTAHTLVAHNMAFDEKILGAEFLRMGIANHVAKKPRKCTMLASTRYCAIPRGRGYKWPRLEELHEKLFGVTFAGAHNAMADVRACVRCYYRLSQLGLM